MEPDPVVLERLRGWAKTRPSVRVVEGFWQTALHALGQFDAVFFDDFPVRRSYRLFFTLFHCVQRFQTMNVLLRE